MDGKVSETRVVEPFDRIVIKSYGRVGIVQGEPVEVVVEASEDVLPKIVTKVVDGTLEIDVKGDWLTRLSDALKSSVDREMVEFRITTPMLKGITLSGAAQIKAEGIEADAFDLVVSGAGDVGIGALRANALRAKFSGAGAVKLAGRVAEHRVSYSGAGSYDAKELETERTTVNLAGAGAARVWATESLEAKVTGIGEISYWGNPEVTERISGLGRVVHKGSTP